MKYWKFAWKLSLQKFEVDWLCYGSFYEMYFLKCSIRTDSIEIFRIYYFLIWNYFSTVVAMKRFDSNGFLAEHISTNNMRFDNIDILPMTYVRRKKY